jgi:hypothetical protein
MGATNGNMSSERPEVRNGCGHSLLCFSMIALPMEKPISPKPHSPSATTRPFPVRFFEIRDSRPARYASGPFLKESNSLDLVGWHPTVAYRLCCLASLIASSDSFKLPPIIIIDLTPAAADLANIASVSSSCFRLPRYMPLNIGSVRFTPISIDKEPSEEVQRGPR